MSKENPKNASVSICKKFRPKIIAGYFNESIIITMNTATPTKPIACPRLIHNGPKK